MADPGRLSRLPGCAGSSGRLLIGQVLQVANDVIGFTQPYRGAVFIHDFQAGYFDLSTALEQLLSVFTLPLRIAGFDSERKAFNGAPRLDAERAGLVLVQRHLTRHQVQALLVPCQTHNTFGRRKLIEYEQYRPENRPYRFEKESYKYFHNIKLKDI